MTKKYAVLNPTDGTYQKFDVLEDAMSAAVGIAFNFYLLYTRNQPFADITVNDDGSETWHSLNGNPILSPEQLIQEQQLMIGHIRSFAEAAQLPVTNL
jgi:hypothetical protein